MAHIHIDREVMFDSPTLVEGLPGVGLVGKITTDHLVDRAKEISDARQQLAQQM